MVMDDTSSFRFLTTWPLLGGGMATLGAGVVWTVGALTTPPQEIFIALLIATFLCGTFTAVLGARSVIARNKANRFAASVLGAVSAAACCLFVYRVLGNEDGPLAPNNLPPQGPRAVRHLRLVNWNVLHGYPELVGQEERFQDTLTALRALDADILILQEAWHTPAHGNMAERLAAALEMNFVFARANGSRRLIGFEEGSAILSRFPIRRADRLVLSPRQPWWEARIALVAVIDLGEQELTVVGTHLGYRNEKVTEGQAKGLLARIPASGFLVLAGDLNTGSDSVAIRRILDAGFCDTVPGGIDHLFLHRDTAESGWVLQKVDWTLRRQDLHRLIGRLADLSDHAGIVADLVRQDASISAK